MTVTLHQGDIPPTLHFSSCVAIDTETMGLQPARDRLCLVQLSAGDGHAHIVQLKAGQYAAPNLKKLLTDPAVTKLFHFARFDIAAIWTYLDVLTAPVYCTKIASRLARTFTAHHSLKTLCSELLRVDLDKQQQTTNWGADLLSEEQVKYAAADVLYLHKLKEILDASLIREGRMKLAQSCFDFLPSRALLDVAGWDKEDIFEH
ncbi:MAG: ribonuclease D [Alphaproteobacteria bacterium]|nr:ribonuclease D [Alphaproteobacteria bacterium]